MKRWMVLVLACLLAFSCPAQAELAAAPAAAPLGMRVLLVEGGADKAAGRQTGASGAQLLLAALPAAAYTDMLYYYKGNTSLCELPQGSLPERAAVLAPWAAKLDKGDFARKTDQSKALAQLTTLLTKRGVAEQGSEALWMPKVDLNPEDVAACNTVLARLLSRGFTLRVALTADLPTLTQVLAQYPDVAVITVADDQQALLDAELPRLGYQALVGDTLAYALAQDALSAQAVLPGEMVAVEFGAPAAGVAELTVLGDVAAALLAPGSSLPLKNGLIAWAEEAAPADEAQPTDTPAPEPTPDLASVPGDAQGDAQAAAQGDAFGDAQAAAQGDAQVAAPGDAQADAQAAAQDDAQAAAEPSQGDGADGATPPPAADALAIADGGDTQAVQAGAQGELAAELTPEPAATPDPKTPTVRLYLMPTADLGIAAACDPASIPYSVAEPAVMVALASDSVYAATLIAGDLTAADSHFRLSAALLPAQGEALPAQVLAMQGGAVSVRLPKAAPGAYTLRLTLDAAPLGFATLYTLDAPLAFEEPIAAGTLGQGGLRLMVQPLLWHSDPGEATVDPAALFTGDYQPVKASSSAPDVAALRDEADGTYAVQALKVGSATLMFVSRGGETLVSVPVEVSSGQSAVLLEAGAACTLILLAAAVWLLLRHTQPRFRKGEQARLYYRSDGGDVPLRALPLSPYRARGVTLWRLLVLSGDAGAWKDARPELLKVSLAPRRDGITLLAREASAVVDGNPGPVGMSVAPGARIGVRIGQREIIVELIAHGQGNTPETVNL